MSGPADPMPEVPDGTDELVQSMSRDEYLDYLVEQAPDITLEQWQETLTILALYRSGRRARGGSPVRGEGSGAAA